MKDYRPNGCKMYVAIKDMVFGTMGIGEEDLRVSKGDVWMLKQITFNNKVQLNKQCDEERVLQITPETLASDFVEVNIKEIDMETTYEFDDYNCTETVTLNGYQISSETYHCAFDDFCEMMEYPLGEWI